VAKDILQNIYNFYKKIDGKKIEKTNNVIEECQHHKNL
jgi:hypothetical protein